MVSGVLNGRKAIVTGGSRGIGRAVVERLASDGADVVFSYVTNADAAADVVSAVKEDGGTATAVQADFSRLPDIRGFFEEAEDRLGGLDIAVLNAAIAAMGSVGEFDEATYDQVMNLNAKGTFFALQETARRIRDGGRVIALSTMVTVTPYPGTAVYSASKAAVEQFAAMAARELGAREITVNTVMPGPTDTDMLHEVSEPDTLAYMANLSPLKRLGTAADIADVIAFLAGPDGRWMTGQNLRTSGGMA